MSLNIQYLSGNVGSDPEVKTLPSGAKVAKFTLATSEKFTGQRRENNLSKPVAQHSRLEGYSGHYREVR